MMGELPLRVTWLLLVVLYGLGTAGLVTAMAHRPGTESRNELTWRADRLIKPALDAAIVELDTLAADFEALGAESRHAIAALNTGDAVELQDAMAIGRVLVDRIVGTAAGLRERVGTLPGSGPVQDGDFSGPTIERWNTINAAIDTTSGLEDAWLALTTGGYAALRLMSLLEAHDEFVAAAAKVGAEGDYEEAVRQLDRAARVSRELRTTQTRLADRADMTVLEELLDRSARLDDALRALYSLLVLSGGETTADVTAALAEVEAARDQMPEDARVITVILSEISRSGPNDAVVRIELARGRLLSVTGALGEHDSGGESSEAGSEADRGSAPLESPAGS